MGPLVTITLATVMLVACAGAFRGALRSLCAADHWRREVRRAAEASKTRSSPILGWASSGCQMPRRVWRFEGKIAGGERGSLELWGAGLLLALTSLLLLQALIWRHRQAQIREHFHQSLCLKEVVGETRRLIADVGALNQAIMAGEVSTWALTFLGGIGLVVRPNWEQVKKGLQLAQEARWSAYGAQLVRLRSSRCRLPLPVWAGPYLRDWRMQRTPDGRAKNRASGSWMWQTPLTTYRVHFELAAPQARTARWVVL